MRFEEEEEDFLGAKALFCVVFHAYDELQWANIQAQPFLHMLYGEQHLTTL